MYYKDYNVEGFTVKASSDFQEWANEYNRLSLFEVRLDYERALVDEYPKLCALMSGYEDVLREVSFRKGYIEGYQRAIALLTGAEEDIKRYVPEWSEYRGN